MRWIPLTTSKKISRRLLVSRISRTPTYHPANFFKKLHENEENLAWGGEGGWGGGYYVDPLLVITELVVARV